MLEVLLGQEVRNAAVVVTRYFGGVLLGTGGLVRAYTQAVKAGLEACEIGNMCHGKEILLETDYNGVGRVLHLLGQKGLVPSDSAYGAEVRLTIRVRKELEEALHRELVEITNGRIKWQELQELYFIDKNQEDGQ